MSVSPRQSFSIGPSGSKSSSSSSLDRPGESSLMGRGRSLVTEGSGSSYLDDMGDISLTSPSSAPPTPLVTSTTHPSQYIHTHHPRRSSLTPLGLNVISPLPPFSASAGSSMSYSPPVSSRMLGFHPPTHYYEPSASSSSSLSGSNFDRDRRRSSAASASTLTQSRPQALSSPNSTTFPGSIPALGKRRSSLTPADPAVAPPSPTRRNVNGRNSRPTTSDGNPPRLQRRPELSGIRLLKIDTPVGVKYVVDERRRGSLPQIHPAGWTATRQTWNPNLPPHRGSGDSQSTITPTPALPNLSPALPDAGFKFGSVHPSSPSSSTNAVSALRAIDLSPGTSSRRGSWLSGGYERPKGKENQDVFEELESQEADRQRKAFFSATYGADGKRARQRLSLGGGTSGVASPASGTSGVSPGGHARRQSLALWERMNEQIIAARMAEAGRLRQSIALPVGPSTATTGVTNLGPGLDTLAARRGSLPIDIPGVRRLSWVQGVGAVTTELEPIGGETGDGEDEGENEVDIDGVSLSRRDTIQLNRPLPPLLPLSDPGPRLLPSTLALHRANHLLSSRNLQSEPLPHPLPPSLHPPAPVDLAEFDIDFILSGSSAQLGGELGPIEGARPRNTPVDVVRAKNYTLSNPPTPAVEHTDIMAKDEDTFAKFVGEFDDEYGGRRGDWTFFRSPLDAFSASALAPASAPLQRGGSGQDPLETSSLGRRGMSWDSVRAGRYEITANGEIRSGQTGATWRVHKIGTRTFELQPLSTSNDSHLMLTTKADHCDHGGVRLPGIPEGEDEQQANQLGQSRTASRMGSGESVTTTKANPMSLLSSLPLPSPFNSSKKKRPSQDHIAVDPLVVPNTDGGGSYRNSLESDRRVEMEELRDEDGSAPPTSGGRGLSFKIKRALKSGITAHEDRKAQKEAAREERERERQQARSWSPSMIRGQEPGQAGKRPASHTTGHSHSSHHASFSNPSGVSAQPLPNFQINQGKIKEADSMGSSSPSTSAPSTHGGGSGSMRPSPRSGVEDLPSLGQGTKTRHFGIGWESVPDEAVAMILPLPTAPGTHPHPEQSGQAQALMVWFVPFTSEREDLTRPSTSASSVSSSSRRTDPEDQDPRHPRNSREREVSFRGAGAGAETTSHDSGSHGSGGSSSKFQKLLKRKTSKEKDTGKRDKSKDSNKRVHQSQEAPTPGPGSYESTVSHVTPSGETGPGAYPLPFRSFRIVARMVEMIELANPEDPASSLDPNQRDASVPPPAMSSSPSGIETRLDSLNLTNSAPLETTASLGSIASGRIFPTIIAVCHAPSQGIEFVVEGLDRLGLCASPEKGGLSAWGPQGYEEWRGTGLSQKGKEVLDVVWVGCTGIMGLAGV